MGTLRQANNPGLILFFSSKQPPHFRAAGGVRFLRHSPGLTGQDAPLQGAHGGQTADVIIYNLSGFINQTDSLSPYGTNGSYGSSNSILPVGTNCPRHILYPPQSQTAPSGRDSSPVVVLPHPKTCLPISCQHISPSHPIFSRTYVHHIKTKSKEKPRS